MFFHQISLYSNYFTVGKIDPNLDDLGLAFEDLNIKIGDLSQYVQNVEPIKCPVVVPKLPVSGNNHIFFPEIEGKIEEIY